MTGSLELSLVEGSREPFLPLLLEADESEPAVRSYLEEGELFAILSDGVVAGEMLVLRDGEEMEIKSIAVAEDLRGRGIGRGAIELLAERAAASGVGRLIVGTADAAPGTHRFYLRSGFRYAGVRRGFFEAYPEPVLEDGLVVRDMVLFDREL